MTIPADALRSVNYGRRNLLDARHAIKEDRLDDAHTSAVWGKAFAEQAIDQIEELRAPEPEPTPEPEPPADRPWAWDARSAPLDPDSSSYISTLLGYGVVRPNLAMTDWAVAVATASPSDPEYAVPCKGNLDAKVRIPLGTKPDPSNDGHLTVLDLQRGREHDFYAAKYDPNTGRISSATAGVSFDVGAVNEQHPGWGGNAANTPLRRGLVTPGALIAGKIGETLQFSTPKIGGTRDGYRFPAIHNAPTCGSDCQWHLPEGSWVRFDPALDVDALKVSDWIKTIARAIQDHGMILRDNGGTMAVYGLNPINGGTTWAEAGLSGTSQSLAALPWDRLQLLEPPRA